MSFSNDYFASAKKLTKQLLNTHSLSVSAKIRRMRDAYLALQANEDWLNGQPLGASMKPATAVIHPVDLHRKRLARRFADRG